MGTYCLPKVITNPCDRTKTLSEKHSAWLMRIKSKDFKTEQRSVCGRHFRTGKYVSISYAKLFDPLCAKPRARTLETQRIEVPHPTLFHCLCHMHKANDQNMHITPNDMPHIRKHCVVTKTYALHVLSNGGWKTGTEITCKSCTQACFYNKQDKI